MKIYYGKAIYNNKEISAAVKVVKRSSLNLIDGPSVKELEKKIAKLFGKKYGLMVNSGSSANLLTMIMLKILKGSGEVIVPSLTWVSDISSVLQNNLKPVFVDINPKNLCMSEKGIISKITYRKISSIF